MLSLLKRMAVGAFYMHFIVWLGSEYAGARSVHPGRDRRIIELSL
jgi:hypothetical protein